MVLPAHTFRSRTLELLRSMVVTVLFAGMGALLWSATGAGEHAWSLFYLSVAASWAVLIPAKMWTERRGDSWTRRIVMLLIGGLVGVGALWMDGWKPGVPFDSAGNVAGVVRTTLCTDEWLECGDVSQLLCTDVLCDSLVADD